MKYSFIKLNSLVFEIASQKLREEDGRGHWLVVGGWFGTGRVGDS